MIIRQGLNFLAHLVAGALLGAIAVDYARRCSSSRSAEPLEPRYTPPPPPASATTEAATSAI